MLPSAATADRGALRVDLHVHVASHSAGAAHASRADGDVEYMRRLVGQVRSSSLDAVVLLAHDAPRDDHGALMRGVDAHATPNETVLRLAAAHPEFLPGVSIHPGRRDALEELERCLLAGAALLKLIPACQNIDLLDPRYARFWARMAEAGLPLLVHCGPEAGLEELRPAFGDFARLRGPLEAGVTVIAAHCGGIFQEDFMHAVPAHARLFGDTATFGTPKTKRRWRSLLQPEIAARLVHGSGLPARLGAVSCFLRGELGLGAMLRLMRYTNPLERDVQIKRAIGLPDDLPTRAARLLCPSALTRWRERQTTKTAGRGGSASPIFQPTRLHA